MDIVRMSVNFALSKMGLRAWLLLGMLLIAISIFPQVEAQNLEIEKLCGDRLSISWGDPPGSGGYQFTPVGDEDADFSCSKSDPSCVVKLKPGKTYSYYLDRVTDDGLVYGEAIQLKGPKSGACPEYIAVTPTPPPPVDTCAYLPADIVVSGFNPFATQCRPVGSAGVGNAALIAQGILRAVDVWGNANADIRVCFRNQGSLKFLDAATAPRAVSDLAAEQIDGMTCGWINRAGTVALMQGGQVAQTAMDVVAETSDSQPPASTGPASTTICQLETTGYLSLRSGPNVYYSRLLSMPRGTSLVARSRIGDWFMVNYQGQLGWASGEYLAISPGCAALGGASAVILPPAQESPMADSQVTLTEASETMSAAAEGDMVEVAAQALSNCTLNSGDIINIRSGPGLEYGIIGEVPFQTSLNATGRSSDWFMVDYDDMAGWVSINYVFRNGACG